MAKLYCPACFRLKDSIGPCGESACGFTEDPRRAKYYLPYRTVLNNRYILGREITCGSFSITYLATDKDSVANQRLVIKEYYPHQIAIRDHRTLHVRPRFPAKRADFEEGFSLFNEGSRICTEISHPNVVSALDFFEQYSTAYLVMDFQEGSTLQELLDSRGKLSPAEALQYMLIVLNGLEAIHHKKALHYDITPANVLLVKSGPSTKDDLRSKPLIIDLNSARKYPVLESAPLAVHGTPGFAAPEQVPNRFGEHLPHTDIYSCAATLLMLTTGNVPPSATDRLEDDIPLFSEEEEVQLPAPLKNALSRSLSLEPRRRPQSVPEFRRLLRKVRARIDKPGPPVARTPLTERLADGAKSARKFLPTLVVTLLLVYLGKLILFDFPNSEAAPKRRELAHTIPPLDYYILSDASDSPNITRYADLEWHILSFFRPQAGANSDRGSYAKFGRTICSCGQPFVYVPTGGNDGIDLVRNCGVSNCNGIQKATRFDTLFSGVGTAIRQSDQRRDNLVFILTDGIPNRGGKEIRCPEEETYKSSKLQLIDKDTREALSNLLTSYPRTNIILVLEGADVCLASIKAQWERATADFGDRFFILDVMASQSLEDATVRLHELLGIKNRAPCVAAWPYRERLSPSQVTDLMEGKVVHTDFCFRSYLDKSRTIFVRRAHLNPLDGAGTSAGRPIWLNVRGSDDNDSEDGDNPAKIVLSSDKGWSSELEREPLYLQLTEANAKIKRSEKYSLDIMLEGARSCSPDSQSLLISANDTSPQAVRKTHRLRLIFYLFVAIFLIFILCCIYYWWNHDNPRSRGFDYIFTDLFWHWAALFFGAGVILFIAYLMTDLSSIAVWSLGLFQLGDNFLIVREVSGLLNRKGTMPRGWHLAGACASALITAVFAYWVSL